MYRGHDRSTAPSTQGGRPVPEVLLRNPGNVYLSAQGRVSKYFTLYSIPLFEAKKLAEYIECQVGGSTWRTRVLEQGRSLEAELANQQRAIEAVKLVSSQLAATLIQNGTEMYYVPAGGRTQENEKWARKQTKHLEGC